MLLWMWLDNLSLLRVNNLNCGFIFKDLVTTIDTRQSLCSLDSVLTRTERLIYTISSLAIS